MHILIIEDDKELCRALALQLTARQYTVSVCHTGSEALYFAMSGAYDLILLDRMLPEIDGLSILRSIRQNHICVPVILTTALGAVGDKIDGLDCGADDYVTKPFSPRVLLAKVNALLRRSSSVPGDTLRAGNLMLLPASHKVYADGREVTLTHKEYELLHFLMTNPEQIFSREQLLNRVWGYDFEGTSRTVDTHIKTLRQKLGGECRHIVTLIRSGYKFEVAP